MAEQHRIAAVARHTAPEGRVSQPGRCTHLHLGAVGMRAKFLAGPVMRACAMLCGLRCLCACDGARQSTSD